MAEISRWAVFKYSTTCDEGCENTVDSLIIDEID